jgi:hypothetical protein
VIPENVTEIEEWAFQGCTNLFEVYFRGDAPNISGETHAFYYPTTIYYKAGATGWTNPWDGCPTATWVPEEPTALSFEVVAGKLVLTFGGGRLEASSDLILWNLVEVTEEGKYELDIPSTGKTFYRVAQ